jgi:hypothetical protein
MHAYTEGGDGGPTAWYTCIGNVLVWPYEVLFKYTVPACALEEGDEATTFGQKHFSFSFFMSIVWYERESVCE